MENVLLSVRHLKKAFGDHMIFEDFDLDVRKGEVVVVIGPSGCGKSTLLRCLNGLEPIQGGEILLDGEPVLRESKSITRMRQKIGMVFQSYELFPHKTILENILLAPMKVQKRPRSDVEKEALELLERVGLADPEGRLSPAAVWRTEAAGGHRPGAVYAPGNSAAGRDHRCS